MVILTYSYNAWGAVSFNSTSMEHMTLASTLSNVNPFTYRGYCYDYDMGMYYLQSRYYDPEICRFINADSTDYLGATGTLLSYNLFAYCENDPVDYVDSTGYYKNSYAFSMYSNMSVSNIVLNASKSVSSTQKTFFKLTTTYAPVSGKTIYLYNCRYVHYLISQSAIYVRYNSFVNRTYTNNSNYSSAYFHKKTYSQWLVYIASRHTTIFNYIEEKALGMLGISEGDWEAFTYALGELSYPEMLSFVPDLLTLYDVATVLLSLLKEWLDKVDDYILFCLKKFEN